MPAPANGRAFRFVAPNPPAATKVKETQPEFTWYDFVRAATADKVPTIPQGQASKWLALARSAASAETA